MKRAPLGLGTVVGFVVGAVWLLVACAAESAPAPVMPGEEAQAQILERMITASPG